MQKRIILKCHDQNKAVITATQMLDSMIHNPRPTRAEATDVANAIFDGSDAVMLSGETASGKYPVAAVQVMDSIARTVETSPEYESRVKRFFRLDEIGEDIAQAVTRSAFLVAREIRATAIIAPTLRGNTPRLISKYRPSQSIIAVTPSDVVQRRLLLYWGVHPLLCDLADNSDDMVNNALAVALEKGLVKTVGQGGDRGRRARALPDHAEHDQGPLHRQRAGQGRARVRRLPLGEDRAGGGRAGRRAAPEARRHARSSWRASSRRISCRS